MSGTNAGAFDRIVEWQKYLAGVDGSGHPLLKGSFANGVQMRAKRPSQVGKELEANGQVLPYAEVEWIVRWRSDITISTRDRLVYKGETYELVAPPMELGRRDALRLLTRVVRPGGAV